MTTATATRNPASDKQRALISRLMDEKIIDEFSATELDGELRGMESTKDASAIIARLIALPSANPQAGTTRFDPAEGLYRVGDDVVRVVIGKSGNWYAKLAVKPAENSGRVNLDWQYIGKRINLKDAEQMSDEDAGRFLVFCMRCGAPLTNQDSIDAGMGPICRNK